MGIINSYKNISYGNIFLNSNLFQTIVLILTIGATVGIALWQFRAHRRKELQNAVSILLLQIKDIEANIEYISSGRTFEWNDSRSTDALFNHNF